MAQTDMDRLQSYGIKREGSDSDSGGDSSDGDGGGGDAGGDTGDPIPKHGKSPNVWDHLLRRVRGTSSYGHEVHAAAVAAFPWLDKPGTFSTYAGGGNHGTGRALDCMVDR